MQPIHDPSRNPSRQPLRNLLLNPSHKQLSTHRAPYYPTTVQSITQPIAQPLHNSSTTHRATHGATHHASNRASQRSEGGGGYKSCVFSHQIYGALWWTRNHQFQLNQPTNQPNNTQTNEERKGREKKDVNSANNCMFINYHLNSHLLFYSSAYYCSMCSTDMSPNQYQ